MKSLRAITLYLFSAGLALAQLTSDQKAFDIQDLAAMFAKLYGPYEWKRDFLGFDLMDTAPWISRAAATQNDLDFYEVMAEYVASLTDSHSLYLIPSNFSATLGFTVDLYDGKVIVDSVNRFLLPSVLYPINVGDELLTVDGANVSDLIPQYLPYHRYGTLRPAMRSAANGVVNRIQAYNPYAANVGKSAVVGIRHAAGNTATLTIPWTTSGLPLVSIDPVASMQSMSRRAQEGAPRDLLAQLQTWEDPGPREVLGYGARNPIFNLPPGWTPRLGFNAGDEFFSGTFPSGNYTLGLLRIASYSPQDQTHALAQFEQEMIWFQQNVDGLIIDQMRNPGGDGCYAQKIVAHLMPGTFRGLGLEVRASRQMLNAAYAGLYNAQLQHASPGVVAEYQAVFDAIEQAYTANRGHTQALPLCGPTLDLPPATDSGGNIVSYTKPLVFLIDDFSASGGDAVPAMLQDNGRGTIAGTNSNGAGGSVGDNYNVGPYSEGLADITLSLMVRKAPVNSSFGPTLYVENVGVAPDVVIDYMTVDNLMSGGRTFLNQAIDLLVQNIQSGQ